MSQIVLIWLLRESSATTRQTYFLLHQKASGTLRLLAPLLDLIPFPSCWANIPAWTMATSMNSPDAVCDVCVNQISDPQESEVDYLARSQFVSAAEALPSTEPVTGESFCQCERQEEFSPGFGVSSDCLCGEEDQGEQDTEIQITHTGG